MSPVFSVPHPSVDSFISSAHRSTSESLVSHRPSPMPCAAGRRMSRAPRRHACDSHPLANRPRCASAHSSHPSTTSAHLVPVPMPSPSSPPYSRRHRLNTPSCRFLRVRCTSAVHVRAMQAGSHVHRQTHARRARRSSLHTAAHCTSQHVCASFTGSVRASALARVRVVLVVAVVVACVHATARRLGSPRAHAPRAPRARAPSRNAHRSASVHMRCRRAPAARARGRVRTDSGPSLPYSIGVARRDAPPSAPCLLGS